MTSFKPSYLPKDLLSNTIPLGIRASRVTHTVKNLPATQDTWVGKIPWRRKGLPTAVFWPGKFHGLYSPWDGKESDTTEQLSLSFQ